MSASLSLLSLNCFGAPVPTTRRRLHALAHHLEHSSLQIVCLQEVQLVTYQNQLFRALASYPFQAYEPHLHAPKGGLVTLSRAPLGTRHFETYAEQGRWYLPTAMDRFLRKGMLISTLQWGAVPVVVINTHIVANYSGDWERRGVFTRMQVKQLRQLADNVAAQPAYKRISDELGAAIHVKHKNHLPTNSFKARGAVNFMADLSPSVADRGIVVGTRGNHGLAVAWAAQARGILCNVVVPEENNPEINAGIISYGAQLIEHGRDFYEVQDYCEELAENAGYYYLRQGNEPQLLNGIATMGLEIFEELPRVDTVIMPIGGGSGCAALGRVIQGINLTSLWMKGTRLARPSMK